MYQTKKTFVKPDMKMADLIFENPQLLLMLDRLGFNLVVHDHTVEQISDSNNINPKLLVFFCNLYNGFVSSGDVSFSKEDIPVIIRFLRNSHHYYKNEKYPEIKDYINQLYQKNSLPEIKMVGKFFNDYFGEVTDHLDYEEYVAFPAISKKLGLEIPSVYVGIEDYSVSVYRDHHTDIESKLSELKNLLLKYIPLKDDRVVRRKLLISLFELEFDLTLHSIIEETILIPLVKKFETKSNNGE